MSVLVAIEGADGAGKATAAANACTALVAQGVATRVISFPRYAETLGGAALGEFLSGRASAPVTAKAAAVLYGLDRLESVDFVANAAATHDVVIFDRYIASNMVYQASKTAPEDAAAMMDWIYDLEVETFGVAPPDLSIYLDTSLDNATKLISLKSKRSYTDRQYDEHESDFALQKKVRQNYEIIASGGICGPWHIVRTARDNSLRDPGSIAEEIVAYILQLLHSRKVPSDFCTKFSA